MSWMNDTVEDRTVTFENGCLTRMRIVWHSSTSFPNRRPLLVSCQASTAPHHTTALPPRNLTQHAWKEMLHKNQGQKHTLLKLYWTDLWVAWGLDASIYIPANYPIMSNFETLLDNIIYGSMGNMTLGSMEGGLNAVLIYAGSTIPEIQDTVTGEVKDHSINEELDDSFSSKAECVSAGEVS